MTPDCSGQRFGIVAARFYADLAEEMVAGAMDALRECNVAANDISVYDVPGCFELPLACRNLINTDRFDALVALGAVIRGETAHFDFVAAECARGIMDVHQGAVWVEGAEEKGSVFSLLFPITEQ